MKEMLKYQELELRKRKIENEIAQSDERKNASLMQQQLKEYQSKIVELNKKSEKVSSSYTEMKKLYEKMANSLQNAVNNVDKADSNQINELINSCSQIMQNLSKMDKEIANISRQITQTLSEYDTIMKNARTAKGKLINYRDAYNKKKESLEPELEKINKSLKSQEKLVDKNLLQKYLAKHNEKVPVFVREQNGRCSGCRMEIAGSKMNVLRANKFIECENCGRIIYID